MNTYLVHLLIRNRSTRNDSVRIIRVQAANEDTARTIARSRINGKLDELISTVSVTEQEVGS